MVYVLLKLLFTVPFVLLFRPRVIGWRNLFFRGKAIIVSNHFELSDPIKIAFVSPRAVHFMAKQELFKNPILRLFMKSFLAFPVNRRHADMASLKQAMTVLDKGRVFGIFPEGRRSITGELDSFEKGAAFLALRCNAPVIPVFADPAAQKRLRIRMIVGEPMDAAAIAASCEGKSVDVVTEALHDRLQALKNEMEGACRA